MSWEELEVQRGVRRDINRWTIVGGKTGGIRVYLAANHPIAQAKRARVFFGKGDDAGWMMIKTTEVGGRAVSEAKGSKAKFIQFSTLPFLPKGIKFGERELEVSTAGADMTTIKVRLPWVSREGRPVAQQLWDIPQKAA